MTQSSLFWTTSGSGDGSASGYLPEQFWSLFRSMFGGDGVASGYLDSLACTLGSSAVSVASGAALVGGVPYINDAPVSLSFTAPTAQNQLGVVVLRANWQAQTVRAVLRLSNEGVQSYPALTQQIGGTYEFELARVGLDAHRVLSADLTVSTTLFVASLEIADGVALDVTGAVTVEEAGGVTDRRRFLNRVRSVATAQLADGATTTAKLADGAVTSAKLASMAAATVEGRAVGAGTGAPVDLSAAQLVAIVATADGAGSGLDADLVDGVHAADFSQTTHNHDGVYVLTTHPHSYATLSHLHSGAYSAPSHPHSQYSAEVHTHSGYALSGHTHGTADITDGSITNAKLANLAAGSVIGTAAVGIFQAVPPVALTPTQVVALLRTLNGVGVGLDADTVDGENSASFALANHNNLHSGVYSPNSHVHSGYSTRTHLHSGFSADSHGHTVEPAGSTLLISANSTLSANALAFSVEVANGFEYEIANNVVLTLESHAYADPDHRHTAAYSALGHRHDSDYSAESHPHSQYSAKTHPHTKYADVNHPHNFALDPHPHAQYSASNHQHSFLNASHETDAPWTAHPEYIASNHQHSFLNASHETDAPWTAHPEYSASNHQHSFLNASHETDAPWTAHPEYIQSYHLYWHDSEHRYAYDGHPHDYALLNHTHGFSTRSLLLATGEFAFNSGGFLTETRDLGNGIVTITASKVRATKSPFGPVRLFSVEFVIPPASGVPTAAFKWGPYNATLEVRWSQDFFRYYVYMVIPTTVHPLPSPNPEINVTLSYLGA